MGAAEEHKRGFHGLELPLKAVAGARAARVVHGHGQVIDQHQHDWACITLPILGQATECWDGGEASIAGPGALLHPPGAYHADQVGEGGLETVSIQFDPKWLSGFGFAMRLEKSVWRAGMTSARQLVQAWSYDPSSDASLAVATGSFLHKMVTVEPAAPPGWLKRVQRAVRGPEGLRTAKIAAQLDLNPAWLARAYRAAVGEGLQETARRRRVEQAVTLLRRTELPIAQVAADSGFCDQSHMTRDFRTLLARTPLQVRSERGLL